MLAGVLGAWVGPTLLRLVFGSSVVTPPAHSALLAAGCTLAVSNLLLMVFTLARDRPAWIARAWVLAIVPAALVLVIPQPAAAVETTITSFLVAEAIAFGALAVAARRSLHPSVSTDV